jgi:hypothetical protein
MKTREQVLEAIAEEKLKSNAIDGRDFSRLAQFFPESDLGKFGMELKEGAEWEVRDFTEEEVKKQLAQDVEFGFEKALNQRGISSSLMYSCVKMWMWVLDDELQSFEDYAQYGLPLFKAVAVKYGFENPIGDDDGDEGKYSE